MAIVGSCAGFELLCKSVELNSNVQTGPIRAEIPDKHTRAFACRSLSFRAPNPPPLSATFNLQSSLPGATMFNLGLVFLIALIFGVAVQSSPISETEEFIPIPHLSRALQQRTTPPQFPDTPPSCPICQKVR